MNDKNLQKKNGDNKQIGAKNPQQNIEEVGTRYDAIKLYKQKFAKKTHNEWDQRDNFQKIEGKYCMVDVQNTDGKDEKINSEIERYNNRNNQLIKKIRENVSEMEICVKNLMSMIWDIDRMQKTLRELNFDTEKNPLGKLSMEQINKGYKVLREIQSYLRQDRCKESVLVELSNQFYMSIPQNYGMKKPPIINDSMKLRQKVELLDILRELDVANKYLNIAFADKDKNKNPLDVFYSLLKCDINLVLDQNIIEQVRSCLRDAHGPTHKNFRIELQNVFYVNRKGENIRYYPFDNFNNRKLLWHGSRTNNFVGILNEGLKIAPPEAPSSGYMFGKGIYFADVPSKSAQYCHHSIQNPDALLLLCDVALGNMYQIFKAKNFNKAPHHYHSIHAVGRNYCDPSRQIRIDDDVTFDTGNVICNEELKRQNIESDLIYNEYVVYDVAQVKIQYIVQVL